MSIDFDPNNLRVTDGMGENQHLEGVHAKIWASVIANLDTTPIERWRLTADACNANEAALILETYQSSNAPHFIITYNMAQGLHTPTVELVAGKEAIDAHLAEFAKRISPETRDAYYPVAFRGGSVTALYQALSERLAAFHTQQADSLGALQVSKEWI